VTEKIKAADFEYVFAYFDSPIEVNVQEEVDNVHDPRKPSMWIYSQIHIVWYLRNLIGYNQGQLGYTFDSHPLEGVI